MAKNIKIESAKKAGKNSSVKITEKKSASVKKRTQKSLTKTKRSLNSFSTPAIKEPQIQESSDRLEIINKIVEILQSRKCENISVLNLESVNSFLSWFVIATANTGLQANAAAREIARQMKEYKLSGKPKMNDVESGWILLDYGDVLIHIMTPEMRGYYDLDKLWGDAKKIQLT